MTRSTAPRSENKASANGRKRKIAYSYGNRWNARSWRNRILDAIDRGSDDSCWIWLGHLDKDGYGQIRGDKGETMRAHRAMYELKVGPIPEGLTIDHLCRNRACVNPDHLEPVTHRENILRSTGPAAVNAKKTHCKRGHEFTDENTLIRKNGSRFCRACNREREAARRAAL